MKEQHKDFADYYIELNNATEAYRKAYPKCKSDKAAATNGSKLLVKTEVQDYIQERLSEKDAKKIASQDEVLETLTAIMRGEVSDQLGLETSVKDRSKAAELLGKRYGLFAEKIDLSANMVFSVKPAPQPGDDDG